MRLEGKVALVTGGAQGIGRAVAEVFAREGAASVVADVQESGAAVADGIRAAGGRAIFVRCDVSSGDDVERAVAAAADEFGGLDVVVNNAYWATMGPLAETTEDDWDRTLAVTLKAVFLTARAALPRMVERGGGAIVNICSVHAHQAAPGFPAYSAAKGGMDSLTRQTAVEWGPLGVRVNSISPGLVLTDGVRGFWESEPDRLERVVATYPLRRLGDPSDVARAAVFLASDDARWITGADVRVDGGLLATLAEVPQVWAEQFGEPRGHA